MPERFAIYYAPEPTHPLARRAAEWLGRDAITGDAVVAEIPGLDPDRRTAVTKSARRYGFHATMKPPFALARGRSQQELVSALAAFARAHPPVAIGKLVLKSLGGFLALVAKPQTPALTDFAAACVADFEPFRGSPSLEERDRRLPGLTPRQIELLDRYGYPYVMDQFLFHLTLTDRLVDADAPAITAATYDWFASFAGHDFVLDRLALFHEPEPGAPFVRVADCPLSTQAAP